MKVQLLLLPLSELQRCPEVRELLCSVAFGKVAPVFDKRIREGCQLPIEKHRGLPGQIAQVVLRGDRR
jgi:hypothetical protein